MVSKKREEIVCFDASTTIKSTTVYCPVCRETKEILYPEAPQLKTIIVECCAKSEKYSRPLRV